MKETPSTENEYALQVLSREVNAEIAKNTKIEQSVRMGGHKMFSVRLPSCDEAFAIMQEVLMRHFIHDIT